MTEEEILEEYRKFAKDYFQFGIGIFDGNGRHVPAGDFFMIEPILGTTWEYKGNHYTVCGFPDVKDDSDARWYPGVAYHRLEDDEPTEDLGNVYVRKLSDFMSKFKEKDDEPVCDPDS